MKPLILTVMLLSVMQAPGPIPGKAADNPSRTSQSIKSDAKSYQKPTAKMTIDGHPSPDPRENASQSEAPTNKEQTITVSKLAPVDVKKDGWDYSYIVLTGILVIIGIFTLIAIWYQAVHTRKAAEAAQHAADAALKQADHIATSERAWMVTEPCDAKIPPEIKGMTTGVRHVGFSVRFKNMGKTPAFLLEIRYSGKVLPSKERLPEVPPEYEEREIFRWEGRGLPLLPQDFILENHVNTWAREPVLIDRGFDVLWVYGYIKYRDAFGGNRETWFCHRWVPEIEGWQKSGFISGGPESYNHAT